MALSPNYGWSEPDNSSLVKNGAQDIRALGDAIDTSVWNVGFGQASKNKIINGDFSVNQRNFTTATSDGTYTFDRWVTSNTGVSCTYTPQTFTAGAAPVAGYESTNFIRILTTGQTATTERTILVQRIENVRTFAAQSATISFWAKAATGTPKIAVEVAQNFGSGGSASVNTYGGQVTLSTSWARYSVTIAVPSISGKTIGTSSFLALNLWVSAGSDFNSRTGSLGIQSNTFDVWGVQAEYGSKMTPFQTATGTIQGELAACQRYLPVMPTSSEAFGYCYATNSYVVGFKFPVTARVAPTGITVNNISNASIYNQLNSSATPSAITLNSAGTSIESGSILVTGTGTAGNAGRLGFGTSASIFFTGCEL